MGQEGKKKLGPTAKRAQFLTYLTTPTKKKRKVFMKRRGKHLQSMWGEGGRELCSDLTCLIPFRGGWQLKYYIADSKGSQKEEQP